MNISNFKLTEIEGNLFDSKESLVHCVSQDLRMGKGIALLFKSKFGKVDELKEQDKKIGQVAEISIDDRKIFYLITKDKYYNKPTIVDLKLCLQELAIVCVKYNIKSLSMPRIGCGLDKLKWSVVKKLLRELLVPIMNVNVWRLK